MPALYVHSHTVVAADIDPLGHANNLAYLHWMQTAAIAHSAAQGWPAEAYQALGAGWVVRSHAIEYLRPALPGDVVLVETWVANMHKVTSLRRYQLTRASDAALLATAATDWAFVHYTTGAPQRIPPAVATAFEIVDR